MKRYVFVLAILVFMLVACGGDKDDSGLESVDEDGNTPRSGNSAPSNGALEENADSSTDDQLTSDSDASPLANIAPIESNIFEMPVVEGLDGQLLFVQGNTRTSGYDEGDAGRIFAASFDGGQPEMLATRVYTTSVILSPDKQKLAYIAADGRRWYLNVLDIPTREVTQLVLLRSQFGNVTGWSPDGEWLTVNVPSPVGSGQIVVKLDGSSSVEIDDGVAFWTSDNRVVFLGYQEPEGGFSFALPKAGDVQIYDPVTSEWSLVDLSFDPTTLNIMGGVDLISELNDQGIELTTNLPSLGQYGYGALILPEEDAFLMAEGTSPRADISNAPPHCGDWEMALYDLNGQQTDLLYEVPDTVYISDIQRVDDTFYYERWYFEGCELDNAALKVALQRQAPDSEVEVITDALYPAVDLNVTFMRVNSGTKYDISPDGRYVVWIDGDYGNLQTSIKLTDLESRESADLMAWQSSNANNFLSFEAFTSVFWIPES